MKKNKFPIYHLPYRISVKLPVFFIVFPITTHVVTQKYPWMCIYACVCAFWIDRLIELMIILFLINASPAEQHAHEPVGLFRCHWIESWNCLQFLFSGHFNLVIRQAKLNIDCFVAIFLLTNAWAKFAEAENREQREIAYFYTCTH